VGSGNGLKNSMEEINISKDKMKEIEDSIEKLLSLLEIEGTFEVVVESESINILIETKDTGMVIGYHGEMLDSLQLIFSLMVSKKAGKFLRTSVDVDGYKKNRSDYLEKLAISTKEKALSENKEQILFSLKPWERRIVHLLLQDDSEVDSESRGEGKERVLVIKTKTTDK